MESISSPAISPDGRSIVFSRGFVDVMTDQNQSNLWVIDADGRRLRQLTDGAWRDSSPVWSPDGARLAFVSNRSGSTQIHVMWVDTRETLQVTRVERSPSGLTWSPDGTRIAVTMNLHYVSQVTTPTMVMTGEADLRTPITQSEEFYRALKLTRKADTLLVRMPEEFHGWRRPSHQPLQQLYLMAWFEKHRTPASRQAIPTIE